MGRHLILACDNCIPGDATGWYLPLALAAVAAVGLAAFAWYRAATGAGRRPRLLWLAGLALLAGPPLSVLAMSSEVTYDRAYCGSALHASLERPRPPLALDATQEGCRARGAHVVAVAQVWGGALVVAAAALASGSAVRGRTVAAGR